MPGKTSRILQYLKINKTISIPASIVFAIGLEKAKWNYANFPISMRADLINWGYLKLPSSDLRAFRDRMIETTPNMQAFEAYHAKCKTEHEDKIAAAANAN